jgi:2',3'-cyclic-nucleotide 2'-phosphodiesterase / 3'-nucleotidase
MAPGVLPNGVIKRRLNVANNEKTTETGTESTTKTYTVDSGDNLSAIAKQELGDANRWREIYELNKDVIGDNPDLIQPGMELKLPS